MLLTALYEPIEEIQSVLVEMSDMIERKLSDINESIRGIASVLEKSARILENNQERIS